MNDQPLDLEDVDDVLEYLSSAIEATHAALDHGISLADSKFSDLPHDPYLWAHIARYGARLHLNTADPTEWQMGRSLPNSGIEVVRMPLLIRVLKAQSDNPPHPGYTAARRRYYTQGAQRLPLSWGNVVIPDEPNFILDWAVDQQREISLALSKPLGLWKYKQAPKLEWRRRIVMASDGQGLRFDPTEENGEILVESIIDPAEAETWQEL